MPWLTWELSSPYLHTKSSSRKELPAFFPFSQFSGDLHLKVAHSTCSFPQLADPRLTIALHETHNLDVAPIMSRIYCKWLQAHKIQTCNHHSTTYQCTHLKTNSGLTLDPEGSCLLVKLHWVHKLLCSRSPCYWDCRMEKKIGSRNHHECGYIKTTVYAMENKTKQLSLVVNHIIFGMHILLLVPKRKLI